MVFQSGQGIGREVRLLKCSLFYQHRMYSQTREGAFALISTFSCIQPLTSFAKLFTQDHPTQAFVEGWFWTPFFPRNLLPCSSSSYPSCLKCKMQESPWLAKLTSEQTHIFVWGIHTYLCVSKISPKGWDFSVPWPSEPATPLFMPGVPRTGFQISLPDLALQSLD